MTDKSPDCPCCFLCGEALDPDNTHEVIYMDKHVKKVCRECYEDVENEQ
jgi:hypothetical protein